MSIVHVLWLVALILGAIDLFRTEGRDLLAWAVVLLRLGLLFGMLVGVLA